MSLMKNKIENRAIIRTLNIEEEEEEVCQQLVPLFPPPKALQIAPKMAPRMTVWLLGFMR